MTQRHYRPADRLCMGIDQTLRTLFGKPLVTERPNPAADQPEAEQDAGTRRHTARLMRINHTGEVCAQGLYQGQALTARLPQVRDSMERAAAEENDHLDWCAARLKELDDRTSWLNPLWYAGSFAIGAGAGLAGDRWSLGFVAETEKQVESHLQGHRQQIPPADKRTHAILKQMQEDEARHGQKARAAGGADLPAPVRAVMRLTARLMTGSVYYV